MEAEIGVLKKKLLERVTDLPAMIISSRLG